MEGCVHVANERQRRKQNTGIVFCKSQIHVLVPFFFFSKKRKKLVIKKKKTKKGQSHRRAQEMDPPLPTPCPRGPWAGPEARCWSGSGFIVLLWKSPYPAGSVCGLLEKKQLGITTRIREQSDFSSITKRRPSQPLQQPKAGGDVCKGPHTCRVTPKVLAVGGNARMNPA